MEMVEDSGTVVTSEMICPKFSHKDQKCSAQWLSVLSCAEDSPLLFSQGSNLEKLIQV